MNTDTWQTESTTLTDLFHRLGNPSDAAFVAQVAWLVDHGHLPPDRVVDAANGPKQVRRTPTNVVAYFRQSLVNGIGKPALDAALAKLPSGEWLTELPRQNDFVASVVAGLVARWSAENHQQADECRQFHDDLIGNS